VKNFAEHAPQLLFTLEVNHRQQGINTQQLRDEIHIIQELGSRTHNTAEVAELVSSREWKPVSHCRHPAKEDHSITFGHTTTTLALASQFPGLNNTIQQHLLHNTMSVVNTAYIVHQNTDVELINNYMSPILSKYREHLLETTPGVADMFSSLLQQLRPGAELTQPHFHPKFNSFAKPVCVGFFYFDKVICKTNSKLPPGRLYLTQPDVMLQVHKGDEGRVMYNIYIHETTGNSPRTKGFLVENSDGEQCVGPCDAWNNTKAVNGETITAQKDWWKQGSCEQQRAVSTKKQQQLPVYSEYFTNTDQKLQVTAGFKGRVKCEVNIYPRLRGFMVQKDNGQQLIAPCTFWDNTKAVPGDSITATTTWESTGTCSQADWKYGKDGDIAVGTFKGAIGVVRRVLFFQDINSKYVIECLEVIGLGGHVYIAPVYTWTMGYAMTVHKAQGSEFDYVVLAANKRIAVPRFLGYRWLYTGVSRAKYKCTLVMDKTHYQTILSKNPDTRPTTLMDFSPVAPNLGTS
jgi:hypothetical protein